jgi:hypothetical protein
MAKRPNKPLNWRWFGEGERVIEGDMVAVDEHHMLLMILQHN